MDISHDGKYLVAGCEDFSVSLYDLERGEKVNTYYSKRYGVDLVKFTHHNKCILAASKRDNHRKYPTPLRLTYSYRENHVLVPPRQQYTVLIYWPLRHHHSDRLEPGRLNFRLLLKGQHNPCLGV